MSAVEDVIEASKNHIMNRMVGNDFFETGDGDIVRLSAITSVEHYYENDRRVNLFLCVGGQRHDLGSITSPMRDLQYADIKAFMRWFVETYLDK